MVIMTELEKHLLDYFCFVLFCFVNIEDWNERSLAVTSHIKSQETSLE